MDFDQPFIVCGSRYCFLWKYIHQNIDDALWILGYDLKRAFLYTYWEFVIELVGEQGVRKLTEIELAKGPYWMDVLDICVLSEVWNVFRVKLMPKETGDDADFINLYSFRLYSSILAPLTEPSRFSVLVRQITSVLVRQITAIFFSVLSQMQLYKLIKKSCTTAWLNAQIRLFRRCALFLYNSACSLAVT